MIIICLMRIFTTADRLVPNFSSIADAFSLSSAEVRTCSNDVFAIIIPPIRHHTALPLHCKVKDTEMLSPQFMFSPISLCSLSNYGTQPSGAHKSGLPATRNCAGSPDSMAFHPTLPLSGKISGKTYPARIHAVLYHFLL